MHKSSILAPPIVLQLQPIYSNLTFVSKCTHIIRYYHLNYAETDILCGFSCWCLFCRFPRTKDWHHIGRRNSAIPESRTKWSSRKLKSDARDRYVLTKKYFIQLVHTLMGSMVSGTHASGAIFPEGVKNTWASSQRATFLSLYTCTLVIILQEQANVTRVNYVQWEQTITVWQWQT